MEEIEYDVRKLMDSNFVRKEQQPDRTANIIIVPEKNRKIQICNNFYDLHTACPKDEFPLPIMDVMIDNMCGFERMCFVDRFSGYNQIKMYPKDEKHKFFRIPPGVYFYIVCPPL